VESKTTPEFWQRFNALPVDIQKLARKNFDLWKENRSTPVLALSSAQQRQVVRPHRRPLPGIGPLRRRDLYLDMDRQSRGLQ
jgi:hypothetical protein